VRGITSRVDIIWTTGSRQVRRINNVAARRIDTLTVYNDSFVIPSLDIGDIGVNYQCEVLVNLFPSTKVKNDFTIPFPSAYVHICLCITHMQHVLIKLIFGRKMVGNY